jgi:hypothetical protein
MKRSAVAFLLLTACGGSSEKSDAAALTGREAATVASAAVTSDSSAPKSRCPHTGMWALCSIENRLRQSGFVAKPVEGDPPKRGGFSVKPIVYTLGKSRLELFVYRDEASLGKDMAGLDTILVAPKGATVTPWESPPVLVRSANIAAVLLGASPRQAERFTNALTAGPPQPGSPR